MYRFPPPYEPSPTETPLIFKTKNTRYTEQNPIEKIKNLNYRLVTPN
jgi:hypothetical protein